MSQKSLFQEDTLKRISSPDQLNGYIRTSGKTIWFALASILLVLIGIIIWGCTGSFDPKSRKIRTQNNYRSSARLNPEFFQEEPVTF